MVFRLASILILLMAGLSAHAADVYPLSDEHVLDHHQNVFQNITTKMAELGYHPSDAPQSMLEDWKVTPDSEYKWFYKPDLVSEVPYVLIAVEGGRKLNMLAQVELMTDERKGILTYQEEMTNIARNLKDISRDLKRS